MVESKEQMTDEQIIWTILDGEKEMYSLLVERYENLVRGYAYYLCRNQDMAGDLAQESFITAYNCLDRIKQGSAFPGWLLGILKNKYRNLGRENKIQTIPLTELGFEPSDSGQKPIFSDEQMEKITTYVYSLTEKYREVILLKYLEDYSYKEIGKILGIPVSTVTMRLIYARKFLCKKAKEDGLL